MWCGCNKIRLRKAIASLIGLKTKARFLQPSRNNLVNLSMFTENNQIGGLVMRVSRAEIELVATLKLRRHSSLVTIKYYVFIYVTIFC